MIVPVVRFLSAGAAGPPPRFAGGTAAGSLAEAV
jgi:hypothetical protein